MDNNNPWIQWLEEKKAEKRALDALFLEDHTNAAREDSPYTIADFRDKLDQLAGCTFLPASFDKRFVRNMDSSANDYRLSVRQANYIEKIYHRYRRQIPNHEIRCGICNPIKRKKGLNYV